MRANWSRWPGRCHERPRLRLPSIVTSATPGSGASLPGLVALTIAWALYFAIHSLLASRRVKARMQGESPSAARRYRLAYNAVALLALAPPLALQWQLAGEPLFSVPTAVRTALDALALAAVLAFLWTLRWYDGRAFLGLRDAATSGFTLSPLHRHVRHPWYFLALIVVWTRPLDAAWLVTASAITLYLIVGSRLEDARLVAEFGEPYRRYRARVPGLWPVPGRHLGAEEAAHWNERPGSERINTGARRD
jgi:protein-S-isoprenylcysteine O-methyltransferase Ste14